jgi:hypothetical protein
MIDVERLAQAWWVVVNEPEDGPWEHASDEQRGNSRAWAEAIAKEYTRLADTDSLQQCSECGAWLFVEDHYQGCLILRRGAVSSLLEQA